MSDKSLEILRDSLRTLHESEQLGKKTHTQLLEQREQIDKSIKNTQQVNRDLSVSNKLVTKMKSWWRG